MAGLDSHVFMRSDESDRSAMDGHNLKEYSRGQNEQPRRVKEKGGDERCEAEAERSRLASSARIQLQDGGSASRRAETGDGENGEQRSDADAEAEAEEWSTHEAAVEILRTFPGRTMSTSTVPRILQLSTHH